MKLNEEKQKKLIEKLNEIWKQPKSCSVCGQNQWDVSDMIFEIREFNGGNLIIGGKSIISPVIQVTCKNCSNTLLFNALKLGLIETDDTSTTSTTE